MMRVEVFVFAGMAAFTFFCGYRIWHPSSRQPSLPTVVTFGTGNDATLAILDSDAQRVWILKRSGNKYEWECIKSPAQLSIGTRRSP